MGTVDAASSTSEWRTKIPLDVNELGMPRMATGLCASASILVSNFESNTRPFLILHGVVWMLNVVERSLRVKYVSFHLIKSSSKFDFHSAHGFAADHLCLMAIVTISYNNNYYYFIVCVFISFKVDGSKWSCEWHERIDASAPRHSQISPIQNATRAAAAADGVQSLKLKTCNFQKSHKQGAKIWFTVHWLN